MEAEESAVGRRIAILGAPIAFGSPRISQITSAHQEGPSRGGFSLISFARLLEATRSAAPRGPANVSDGLLDFVRCARSPSLSYARSLLRADNEPQIHLHISSSVYPLAGGTYDERGGCLALYAAGILRVHLMRFPQTNTGSTWWLSWSINTITPPPSSALWIRPIVCAVPVSFVDGCLDPFDGAKADGRAPG